MKSYLSALALLLCALLLFVSCDIAGGTHPETTASPETTGAADEITADAETTDTVTTFEETTAEETTAEATTSEETTSDPSANTTGVPGVIFSSDYLSVGDSIANGYGLMNQTAERYSALLQASLSLGKLNSSAVDGQTSSELVLALESGILTKGNSLVTVSTGANNILRPAIPVLLSALTNPQAAQATLTSAEFDATLKAGIAALAEDLPKIVQKIRAANPDADIVLMTVYNPFKGVKGVSLANGFTVDFDLSALTDGYICAMNEIIKTVADETGCILADVYTAFEESEIRVVNVIVDENGYVSNSYDPHPNAAGHQLIADVIRAVLSDTPANG